MIMKFSSLYVLDASPEDKALPLPLTVDASTHWGTDLVGGSDGLVCLIARARLCDCRSRPCRLRYYRNMLLTRVNQCGT